jgi:hypothetical protein
VNPQRIQYITQNPNGEAVQYASNYAAVRAEYNSQYMPLIQSISGGGKSILDDLKAMGQSAFTQLASQVLAAVTNKIQQKLTINAILPVVNQQFYNPLRLKLWSELDIPERIITTSSTPINQSQPSSSTSSTSYQPVPENQQQAIIIPAPTVNSLMGR